MEIYLGLIEPSSNFTHEYSKFATSYDHFVKGGGTDIEFIFMRDQNSPHFITNFDEDDNVNFIFTMDQKFATDDIRGVETHEWDINPSLIIRNS